MITLQKAYTEYLKTQVIESSFEKDLSTEQYSCWSIPQKQDYTVHNWLGEYIGTSVIQFRNYIWLGRKGAIYVTKSPKFEKKQANSNIVLDMKQWVWKKFNI